MRFLLLLLVCTVAFPQSTESDYRVYTEHPRLLLNARRHRLLQRERERQSPRWIQLETLIRGKARLPEPAFSAALFGRIAEDSAALQEAVAAAKRPGATVREVAVALDWAAPDDQDLKSRLTQSLNTPVRDFASARDRAFASILLGNGAALRDLIESWWRKETAPRLRAGTRRITHADLYPLAELFHVVRDNLQIDLKEEIPVVFRDLAVERVLGYYPAVWPAAENEYRIPWFTSKGDPDLNLAALNRAAEMALVAFESNAQEMQFLQGWLQHDRFVLRGPFGAPYEFLWANPYQPGLPFEKLPLVYHDERSGLLLLRSSWEEDATWLGYFGASGQIFRNGQIEPLRLKQPSQLGTEMVVPGDRALTRMEIQPDTPDQWFVLGLKPNTVYDIETDGENMYEGKTDPGGILVLSFTRKAGQAVFIHEPRRSSEQGSAAGAFKYSVRAIVIAVDHHLTRRTFAGLSYAAARAVAAPTPFGAVPSPHQLRWHQLEFYAFLHFTINTFTDKEWDYGDEDPNLFHPSAFDADAIVSALATAGMKAVILTCKHHDGFCLWPTKTTEHSVRSSRWCEGKV